MDGGQHWTMKHSNPAGALLLVLHFVDAKFGYAAGTGGTVVFTVDGGNTWDTQKLASETILQAAFGDPNHGIIRTRSALLATDDGGKSWHPIVPANDPGWEEKFPYTVDLAALDKDHLAARVGEGEFGDGEYLTTTDGGKTWAANYIPSVGIHDLIAADHSYYSIGHEVLGKDKPGGGYGVAMSFRSKDGIQWDHISLKDGVCKSEHCGGCTAQGCFASAGTVVDLENGKSWMVEVPPHDNLSDQWAAAGGRLCLLSDGAIECASATPVKTLESKNDAPIKWAARSLPRLGVPQPPGSGPQCIRCALPPMLVTQQGGSGPVQVQVRFTIEPSGQADNIVIAGKLPEDVAPQLRAAVSGWLFEPILQDGKPIAKDVAFLGRFFVVNAQRPGIKILSTRHPNQ